MNIENEFISEEKRSIIFLIISTIALVLSFFRVFTIGTIDLAWITILLCGIPIIKDAAIGLVTEFDIKTDLLVSIALIASIIIGEIFAAGEIAVIMALGGLLEEFTVARSRAGIEKLVDSTPRTARIVSNKNNNADEKMIDAKEVAIGDLIKVLPGETVPVDGELVNGEISIDQSIMTGESIPVDKLTGDEIFSGTVNQFGSFVMKATKIGKDSSLQRMIDLVESADAEKSKIVRLTDRWATWIVVIALTAAIATYFLTGEIIRSVTVLVVFCPCALVLATLTAIIAAIGNLTKYEILVKEGDALERLSQVKKVLFDKTGTLTYGKPKVLDIINYTDDSENDINNELSEDNSLIKTVASLENKSEHPLGKAVVTYYRDKYYMDQSDYDNQNNSNSNFNINSKSKSGINFFDVENFEMTIGKGIKGLINGEKVLAGNKVFLECEANLKMDENWIKQNLLSSVDKGTTIIYIAINNVFKGAIILGDSLREDVKDTIANIEKLDLNTVLLTGDSEKPAKHIADQVGIDELYYNCLPKKKMNIIDAYQNIKSDPVAMIGDGVNDAPSLKKAHVGIAMGGIGSDIAVEAADIALIGDDIKSLPHLLGISKKTMQTININIIISLALNFVAIILAMLGILDPITGALVHNVGSVLVVIYSSLLLKWK
ncbi:Copper-exporting P-type ATPase B [Candidatus Methanobinarius endosymbioticus]|uniref:Copper-exporting P-type ATPase B n=1 Tax=Candidatus Methanobinarius endosymbioticus TaxID=2006182 RepID=A0A366MDB3_9EURY|nr:Copper-exporting P-type ATPase B [Candidatus Methanobinarius endosymbioticus]